MRIFRLSRHAYAEDLSGIGAALNPGRWNKAGTPVLYCSERPETALLETLVNLPPMMIPDLVLLTIEIPDESYQELTPAALPQNWFHYPAPTALSLIGKAWIDQQVYLALKVPSAVVHTAGNFLLNVRHPRISEVKVIDRSPFYFDRRLSQQEQ